MLIDFSKLDNNSESETLELKQSFDNKALETIGAFANTTGGTILIGVRDDGRVTGVTLGSTTLEEWAQKMQSKLQPRQLPSITSHNVEGRTVVSITVKRCEDVMSVDGRYIKRVGRTNQAMSPTDVKQRLLASGNASWDNQIEPDATIDDLDQQAIKDFISKIKECGRRTVPGKEQTSSILNKLELTKDGKPTRAAILLLAKNPQRFYFSAYIKAGRFKSPTTIVDDKEFGGTLFQQLESVMDWFRDRLATKLLIGSKKLPSLPSGSLAQRQEVWEYPLDALREAVTNALCHRDYTSPAATTMRLYDDHLEIWNPGFLPFQLTLDDLLREHDSYPTNKLIASCFFNVGLIERWGAGTLLIANALKAQEQPPPTFDDSHQHTFRLTLQAGAEVHDVASIETELNERQLKTLAYLRTNDSLTAAQYQDLFDTSRATATRDLTALARRGIIAPISRGKFRAYRLVET